MAAKSVAGFAGYAGAVEIDYALMAGFTCVAIAGSFLGGVISHRVSPGSLTRGFAVFLILVATYILISTVGGGDATG